MQRPTKALAFSRLRFTVLLLAVFWLTAGCIPLHAASIPDWVRQAASQTLPSYPPDINAVVLLRDETDTITGPGEYVEHYRRVVKILRPDGRNEGNLSVYLGQKQKLLSLRAWSLDKTGREYELKEKDFADRAPYADDLYDDIHFRTATAPAAEPGSVIAFEYEARRQDWDNQMSWFLQEDIPVRQTSLTLQLPASWEFKDSWAATPAIKPVAVGENGWQWTQHDLPAIEEEPYMPSLLALSARMTGLSFRREAQFEIPPPGMALASGKST